MRLSSVESFIESIYPDVHVDPPSPSEYFLNWIILAPWNANVGDLNEQILNHMSGDVQQYVSANEMICEAGADPKDDEHIPVKFLWSINSSSLPPGELNLKVRCPIILLYNIFPSQGLLELAWMLQECVIEFLKFILSEENMTERLFWFHKFPWL